MNINFIRRLFTPKRYCPKCGIRMEYVKVKSNSKAIANSNNFLQCPQCKSVLYLNR